MKRSDYKFNVNLKYATYENCKFLATRYNFPPYNLALIIEDVDGSIIAICSVNPKKSTGDMICIKDWSENEGMVEFLVEQRIIENKPDYSQEEKSGYVTIHPYPLAEKGKELFKGI